MTNFMFWTRWFAYQLVLVVSQPGCGPCSWGSAVPWHAGGQLTVPPCCLSQDSPHLLSHYMTTFAHLLLLHHHHLLPFHPPKKKRTETWERLHWCWDEKNRPHKSFYSKIIYMFFYFYRCSLIFENDISSTEKTWYWWACVPNFKTKTENISLWKHCKRETVRERNWGMCLESDKCVQNIKKVKKVFAGMYLWECVTLGSSGS